MAHPAAMNPLLNHPLLLVGSNVFMTFAWHDHLRNLGPSPWYLAALISWGIALFEYLLQVPANRIGYGPLNLAQLKILQEVTRYRCSSHSRSGTCISRSKWITCMRGYV